MANTDPQLVKSTALAKATQLESRVNLLVASAATELSPTVVYLEGADPQLSVNGSVSAAGVWTCPAGINSVQIECWGAGGGGGGGGGGTTTSGGGGGGGGEYALETAYAVIPGNIYTFAVGRSGQGGVCGGSGGHAGGTTVFDTTGPGVIANGGLGGDSTQYNGGSGSTNSVHYNGGSGGISTAGVASDDPTAVTNLLMWWRMDDNPAPGTSGYNKLLDYSGNNYYGTVGQTGGRINVSTSLSGITAPAQSPTRTNSKETYGNAVWVNQGSSAYAWILANALAIGSGQPAPRSGAALTISVWIKNNPNLTSWGIGTVGGHQYSTILANCDYTKGISTNGGQGGNGYALFLQAGQPVFYLNNQGHGGYSAAVGSTISTDNNWHQIVATWDGTNLKLYQDGSLKSTVAGPAGFTAPGAGPNAPTVGINPSTQNNSPFVGCMSNLWVAGSAVTSTYVTHAYGQSPSTGGSGGGASGGSAGQGNSGTSATTSSGAAGGAAANGASSTTSGSYAGANGGNSGANGSTVSTSYPGGGGGGAGTGSSLSAVNVLSVVAQHSATYAGIDATGGNNGALYSVSDSPQFGIPSPYPGAALLSSNMYVGGAPGSASNGTLNSVALLPYMGAALKGLTVNTITLTLTIQSTNASVLPVGYGVAANAQIPQSLGSDSDIATYLSFYTPLVNIPIPAGPAGRQVTFDITNSTFITYCKNISQGTVVALVFGGLQGSPTYGINDGNYSASDSYAWNTVLTGADGTAGTDLTINFETWTATGGNTTGGDGGPGQLILSYIDPRYWPVVAIQPAATTDSDNNSFAAGITAESVVGFDPTITTPPLAPATWKSLGTISITGLVVTLARYRYAPDDGGTLVVEVEAHISGTLASTALTAFSVTLPSQVTPGSSAAGTSDVRLAPLLLNSGLLGTLQVYGTYSGSAGKVYLNWSSGGQTSGIIYGYARIPLT